MRGRRPGPFRWNRTRALYRVSHVSWSTNRSQTSRTLWKSRRAEATKEAAVECSRKSAGVVFEAVAVVAVAAGHLVSGR